MKKGFTLIELLAVILILGIIALIAIPQVTNVIDKANGGAAETTGEHYISAINTKIGLNKLDTNSSNDISDGEIDVNNIEVDITGEGPKSGIVYVENGQVKMADLEVNGYSVLCNKKGKCEATKGTFKYYASAEEPPTNISDYPSTRPVDKLLYLKYEVNNNAIVKGQVCLFDGEKEICITPGEYEDNKQKIIDYYGYNDSWHYNSMIGYYFKYENDMSISCSKTDDSINCMTQGFLSITASKSSGYATMQDLTDPNSIFTCGFYPDEEYGSCY